MVHRSTAAFLSVLVLITAALIAPARTEALIIDTPFGKFDFRTLSGMLTPARVDILKSIIWFDDDIAAFILADSVNTQLGLPNGGVGPLFVYAQPNPDEFSIFAWVGGVGIQGGDIPRSLLEGASFTYAVGNPVIPAPSSLALLLPLLAFAVTFRRRALRTRMRLDGQ